MKLHFVPTLCLGLLAFPVAAVQHSPVKMTAEQPWPIRAIGAHSMSSLMECWITKFEAQAPAASILFEPDAPGQSGAGVPALAEGRADIAPMAREFFPRDQTLLVEALGQVPQLVPVAMGSFDRAGKTHAIAVYVHELNPLQNLSLDQLRAVLTGRFRTWGELGLEDGWDGLDIHVFGMLHRRASGNPPGIVNFIEQRLGIAGQMSGSITQLTGSPQRHALAEIVAEVSVDKAAIGYSGFGFSRSGARALALSNDAFGPTVSGSAGSVASGSYPLSRHIYLALYPHAAGPRRASMMEFVRFVLDAPGQACVARDATGFFPLPGPLRREAMNQLDY